MDGVEHFLLMLLLSLDWGCYLQVLGLFRDQDVLVQKLNELRTVLHFPDSNFEILALVGVQR